MQVTVKWKPEKLKICFQISWWFCYENVCNAAMKAGKARNQFSYFLKMILPRHGGIRWLESRTFKHFLAVMYKLSVIFLVVLFLQVIKILESSNDGMCSVFPWWMTSLLEFIPIRRSFLCSVFPRLITSSLEFILIHTFTDISACTGPFLDHQGSRSIFIIAFYTPLSTSFKTLESSLTWHLSLLMATEFPPTKSYSAFSVSN